MEKTVAKNLLMDFLVRKLNNKEFMAEALVSNYLDNDKEVEKIITTSADNCNTNIAASHANELLETVINLQKRLDFMILSTPTGIERDVMTEENIKVLELIFKCNK
jgi:hypothetical protein